MSKFNPDTHVLVKADVARKLEQRISEVNDLLVDLEDTATTPPSPSKTGGDSPNLDRERSVIAKHHHAMFLHHNSQTPPTEDDQRHLDEMTESLIKQLYM